MALCVQFSSCKLGLVARSDMGLPGIQVMGSAFRSGKNSFVKVGHEVISMVILPLLLIQVGLLSVTGKRTG